jgi:ubiquinone/menaquinone biosynthesis C-methylase UbiE
MTRTLDHDQVPRAAGLILHKAIFYDLTVWLMTMGRETALRETMVRLARLEPGEAVLDVGCGTGSLAIAAKRRVGESGTVYGIDASPEMRARAEQKATRARVEVIFKQAAAQALPFPDAQFDVVLSTVMLHHLPRKGREQYLHEARRVVRPKGRVLVVDFAKPTQERREPIRHLHRHGSLRLEDIIAIMKEAGLHVLESGKVGFRDLQFALATVPDASRITP